MLRCGCGAVLLNAAKPVPRLHFGAILFFKASLETTHRLDLHLYGALPLAADAVESADKMSEQVVGCLAEARHVSLAGCLSGRVW